MIEFEEKANRIQLKVNLEVVRNNGLTISFKLLRLVEVVSTEKVNTP